MSIPTNPPVGRMPRIEFFMIRVTPAAFCDLLPLLFMAIHKLPPLLVSQIAAGEVIERPASVVKELVENSLDAGATHIEITIEQGGQGLIRIADNGHGISHDELSLAVAPHATSKLTSADQLASIATLGFRGEALASIASVSRLRLTSRPITDGRPAEAGAVIEASGPNVSTPAPVGCAPGTTIEVRDLFFNTPARRKFMRSPATEFGQISEIITRVAMVHPSVAFKLVHNQRTAIDLPADQSPRQRVVSLLGRDLDDALLEFESTQPNLDPDAAPITTWGLAGTPAIARATAKFQYFFVNSRPVRDRNLAHALKEAYRGLMPPDRQPLAVVVLRVDPAAVDVNVHPTKAEVRFRDPARIHGHLLSTVRQRLLGADLTPTATIKATPSPAGPPTRQSSPHTDTPPTPPRTPAISTRSQGQRDFVNYFKQRAHTQNGLDFDHVKQALAQTPPRDASQPHPLATAGSDQAGPITVRTPQHATTTLDADAHTTPQSPKPTPTLQASRAWPYPVLQVHDSYLITQDSQGLLIVDQHALHERVMFEQLRDRVLGAQDDSHTCLESQRLLTPAVVKASPKRIALLDQLKPLFERIGIEVDPIGPDALAVHAFPSFLFDRHVDPVNFLDDLFDLAEDDKFLSSTPDDDTTRTDAGDDDPYVEEAVLHKVLDMMACKAAVKAHDMLTPDEMASLLAQRDQIERASSCPHGRPTTIRLTLKDLEKQFKRT